MHDMDIPGGQNFEGWKFKFRTVSHSNAKIAKPTHARWGMH